MGVRKLVFLVVAVDKVLQDRAALKDADLLAVLKSVSDGRDASVGVDLEEPGRLDLVVHLADVGVADA